jgi:hypothetical protein
MAVTTPEWLAQRGGELKPSKDGLSWTVYLRGEPLYLLVPVPVKGAHGCRVSMTNNDKRLDQGKTFPTFEDAVKGGLDDLRAALGW